MNTAYQYSALNENLDQIRLLKLLPAPSLSDPIHCLLLPVSLASHPPYTALSYTWGRKTNPALISVDNEDGNGEKGRTISISENLEAALRRLRNPKDSVQLWIDQICINQNDDKKNIEKAKQVTKMKRIYQAASKVDVWLGEEEKNSDAAWKLMVDIADGTLDSTLQIIQEKARGPQFDALHDLFRRQYWERIWVVQEVGSNDTVRVLCGKNSIPWANVEAVCDRLAGKEASKLLATHIRPDDATFRGVLLTGGPKSLKLPRSSKEHNRSLLDLLRTHKAKYSTLPQEKVFALVGISTSENDFGAIEYDLPVRSVFIHTAQHVIQKLKTLDIICVRQNDIRDKDFEKYKLPSWVPDWERRILSPRHRIVGLHRRDSTFRASGDSEPDYEFLGEGGNVLKVRGFVVDTIGQVGKHFFLDGNGLDEREESKILHTLDTIEDWWKIYSNALGSAAMEKGFCCTVYGGETKKESDPLPPEQRFEAFQSLEKLLPEKKRMLPPLEHQTVDTEKEYRAMVSAAGIRMHGHCFAISSRQKFSCLVPSLTAIGDQICILHGCSFPVVLHSVEKQYVLVGETYVHGIMKGEAIEDFMMRKYEPEYFELL